MATATKPKPRKVKAPINQLKLMGPGQIEFKTFLDQCMHFGELYWPDWNNCQNPRSYIIPRVYNYLHPDVSDDAIQIVQDRATLRHAEGASYSTLERLLTDRTSDIAECLVFTALQQLVEDNVQAPMTVVHNLDIHSNQKLISQLFPIVNEYPFREDFGKCDREYDFLIISPHTGIVAIEVKSSQYTAPRDFIATNTNMPKRYYEGLLQLETVDALFRILGVCADIDPSSKIPIRKIIFTPNLTRERFDIWKNSMDIGARQKVESNINDVIQWFTEDMDNCAEHSNKPPMYSTLRNILEIGALCIRKEIGEKLALFVSGFRSMILLGKTNAQLDTVLFSQNEAIQLEHRRIAEQEPFAGQKTTNVSEYSLLEQVDRTKLDYEPKLFFLSPDQQVVIEGPPKQFVTGVAGTGKTVILQAKALELLSKGEEVVVFAARGYKEQYKQLFDNYGFDKYELASWPYKGFGELRSYLPSYIEQVAKNGTYNTIEVMKHICEYVKQEFFADIVDWLADKHVMFDDACDELSIEMLFKSLGNLFAAWSIMTFTGATKVTWAAFDPTLLDFTSGVNHGLSTHIFQDTMERLLSSGLEQKVGDVKFRVTILTRVMRCSESVYHAAYFGQHKLQWPNGMEPILGHKVRGLTIGSVVTASEVFDTKRDAMRRLRDRVEETLHRLSRDGVDLEKIAVVLGKEPVMGVRQGFPEEFTIANVSIPVYKFFEVSSMEWPIVVFGSCLQDVVEDVGSRAYYLSVGYARYRAMTRATTKLIEITLAYRESEFSWNSGDSPDEEQTFTERQWKNY